MPALDLGDLTATIEARVGEFEQGLDRAETSMHRFRNEVEDIADATAEAVDRELAPDGREMQQGLDQAESRFERWSGRIEMAAAAAGAVIGAALTAALVEAMDVDAAQHELEAALGDEAFAKHMGEVAGQLYMEGWGESVRDNMTAVQAIWSSGLVDEDATQQAIATVTSQAQALAQVLGIDVADAANYANTILQARLAKDATEAFDLMLAASRQVPMALRQDLLMAVDEYGQFFGALGFSGTEVFGALAAASEKGTWGIDKLGDSIKEFTLLSTDVDAAAETYKALGLDAQKMANDLLAGGDRANTAFFKIVTALQAVKDPAKQAQLAIALFGTPLEDMNKAEIPEFLERLKKAERGIGDFAGETQEAADALGGSASAQLEVFKRKLQHALVEQVAKAVPYLTDLAKWGAANESWLVPVIGALGGLATVLLVLAGVVKIVTFVTWLWNAALYANPIGLIILAIIALVAGFILLYNNVEWFRNAVNAVWDGIVAGAKLWWDAVQIYWNFIKTAFLAWLDLFIGTWTMVFNAVGVAVGWIVDKWNWLVAFVTSLPGKISSAASGMWDGIKNSFKSAINWVLSKWNNLSFKIPGVSIPGIGQVWGGMTLRVPGVPLLDVGGDITRTGLAVVHAGERVVPAAQAERLRDQEQPGRGGTITHRVLIEFANVIAGLRQEIANLGGDVQAALGDAP
ncbi:hypothetical protein GCM10009557_05840 [Virgisporangium ochraceum]|uniref:Phage tail tape measure protein domain-containing protein n=1 Tax=Virgisporangium ochraceum TaxID=65505 RepID=A0A8J3ZM29_9ACTN|nr:phage tail protein [Virgisporangium ochraceum]GIJ66241.1 hypothetical protein Voc01_011580 [Virgisporangium ochraceum]